MKLKLAAVCSVTLLACAAAAAPAFAGQLNWNFYDLTGMLAYPGSTTWNTTSSVQNTASDTATFTQGGDSLLVESATSPGCATSATSCAWSMPASSLDLYAKNGGSNAERGLGLTGDPSGDNEIYYPNGIYLSLPSGVHASDVMIGSIQGTSSDGETWAIWGSNGNGWTELGYGMGGLTENFNSSSLLGYNQLIISDPSRTPYTNSNDIVLMSISTVPEPGTLALFGAGLLGCALVIARRRARQS